MGMFAFWIVLVTALPEGPPRPKVVSAFEARTSTGVAASAGAPLFDGDRLTTGPGGGASVWIFDGASSYVGPSTTVGPTEAGGALGLRLDRGEILVNDDGAKPVTIEFETARLTIGRGTLHASTTTDGLRVWAEAGRADIRTATGTSLTLAEGQEVQIARSGAVQGPKSSTGAGWTVDVEEIRLAAAAASSRSLMAGRVTSVNDALAAELTPDGRLDAVNSPASAPSTTGDAPPPGTDPQPNAADESAQQPIAVAQPNTGVSSSTISLALGGISASTSGGVSGGLFSDAQQDSRNLAFPGNVHLVTAQSTYTLNDVNLRVSDHFAASQDFWSIGIGKPPTSQVLTTFNTGSAPTPRTVPVPGTNAYLVQFPAAQFGIPDPATNNAAQSGPGAIRAGVTGLVGSVPTAPQVRGANPLLDARAVFNNRATFALGEFSVQASGNHPEFAIRRSDQDRRIVKGPFGNDNLDVITANPQVKFTQVRDSKFFPELATVNVPVATNPLANPPTYHALDPVRKAAFTTLVAESLSGYAARTGQTRFVVDKEVIDITGYPRSNAAFLRSGAALPGQSATSLTSNARPRHGAAR